MIRRAINKKSNRIMALIISFTIILAATLAINGTFAAPNDINVEIQRLNNYQELEKNTTDEFLTAGIADYELSDYSLATASINKNTGIVKLTGKKAGVVTLALGTKGGLTFIVNYQITDSTNISKYIIREKGEVTLAQAGSYKDTLVTVTEGTNNIKWKSLNTNVATVNENAGRITAVAKGTAIVLGTFTDKWGVAQDIHILVGVAVNLNGSNFGELIDLINKGEETLASNPNPYDENSLNVLQDVVDKGKSVLNSNNPTDSVINDAIKDLKDALNNMKLKPGGGNIIKGPDGNHYRPVGRPPNVYEVVDEDGKSKYPPEYVYNEDGNPGNGKNKPAHLHNGKYWVEDPKDSNIWKEIDDNGNLKNNNVIWGGEDGKPSGGDDKPVTKFGKDWWVNMGQNVWRKVTGQYTLGVLTGGGPSEDPSASPVYEIYDNTANDGKYYVGQLGPDSSKNYYFYGDKPLNNGGDGKITSTAIHLANSDQKYYLSEDNKTMVTEPPVKIGVITSITITGPASVKPDSSNQFNVNVNGTGGPVSQEVTWTVSGGKSGTTIVNGLLTVAKYETAETLTVKATSVVNTTISQVYYVSVILPEIINGKPTGADTRVLTHAQTGDGVWIEIATNSMYSLIVRAAYVPNTNLPPTDISLQTIRGMLDNWYNETLASNARLRKFAVKNTALSNRGAVVNYTIGWSAPTRASAPTGEDVAFLLSVGEAGEFFSNGRYYEPYTPKKMSSPTLARNNWAKYTTTDSYLLLRTISIDTDRLTDLSGDKVIGDVGYTSELYGRVHRMLPAMWVESAIFDAD